MVTKKIFLASSKELESDRRDFEIFIGRKNKELVRRGLFLELVLWEDFLDAMSKDGLQSEYNKRIRECDIFIMLFFTKVGQYTEEEFETAVGHFQATNRPFVFTFFKDAPIRTGSADRNDLRSVWAFQDKLNALRHFWTIYTNIEDLKLKFIEQLEKLANQAESGFDAFKSVTMFGPPGSWEQALLHTFLGLEPTPVPITDEVAPMDRTQVFRLWADAAHENSISASLNKSDGVHLIRIRFTNLPASLPGDVTIRPLGLKAIAVEKEQYFLTFDVRAPRKGLGNAEHEQRNEALAVAVRIIDAKATQWSYQSVDMRRLFPIDIGDTWRPVCVDLRGGWVRFDGDGNYYYAAEQPDFSVIAGIVIEVGTVAVPRPGPGTGELEISRIRITHAEPASSRPTQ